jgi:hypothetical protein
MILSSTSVMLSTCQACTPKYSRNARSMMSTVTYVLAKQTHVREIPASCDDGRTESYRACPKWETS